MVRIHYLSALQRSAIRGEHHHAFCCIEKGFIIIEILIIIPFQICLFIIKLGRTCPCRTRVGQAFLASWLNLIG